MGRVLGLDLGRRRIGVAVCDDARILATPLQTIGRVGDQVVEHRIVGELLAEYGATLVVVGLPLSLDGSDGPAARQVRAEVRKLHKRLGIEVVTHDERFTTRTAEQSLRHQGIDQRGGREVIDAVAASVILQSWIDARSKAHSDDQLDTQINGRQDTWHTSH